MRLQGLQSKHQTAGPSLIPSTRTRQGAPLTGKRISTGIEYCTPPLVSPHPSPSPKFAQTTQFGSMASRPREVTNGDRSSQVRPRQLSSAQAYTTRTSMPVYPYTSTVQHGGGTAQPIHAGSTHHSFTYSYLTPEQARWYQQQYPPKATHHVASTATQQFVSHTTTPTAQDTHRSHHPSAGIYHQTIGHPPPDHRHHLYHSKSRREPEPPVARAQTRRSAQQQHHAYNAPYSDSSSSSITDSSASKPIGSSRTTTTANIKTWLKRKERDRKVRQGQSHHR